MTDRSDLPTGALLMVAAGTVFIGYGLLLLALSWLGDGLAVGGGALAEVARADLHDMDPAILHTISRLRVATAGFLVSTGLAVVGLARFGVGRGEQWACTTAVAVAVVGPLIALPLHWLHLFDHGWLLHLGPAYLAAAMCLVGAGISREELHTEARHQEPAQPVQCRWGAARPHGCGPQRPVDTGRPSRQS